MNAFLIVGLAATFLALIIPIFMWFLSDRTPRKDLDIKDLKRAKALPYFKDGHIPENQERALDSDSHGFKEVLFLFFKAWPFVRPYLFGMWHEFNKGKEDTTADAISGDGFSFIYGCWFVTFIAIIFPVLGLIKVELFSIQGSVYFFIAAQATCLWLLELYNPKDKYQVLLLFIFFVSTFFLMLLTILVMDGVIPIIYSSLIVFFSILCWVLQIKFEDKKIRVRLRVRSHLIYLYSLAALQGLVSLPLGILIADLLNMSLLQSQPLQQDIASSYWFDSPEMGVENTENLTADQRHDLKWTWVYLNIALWAVNLPIGMIVPYYTVWIMQKINQDMRVALVDRWHQLSLSFHSDNRTGDSVFRIYQDSAQVNAVIGRLIDLSLVCWYYIYALLLLSFLSPTMGLITILLLPVAILWARWAMPRMRISSLVYRSATSSITSRIQESFASIRLIKSFNSENKIQDLMEKESVVAMNSAFRMRRLVALVTIVMFVLASIFLISGEFYMAINANRGNQTFANELIALIAVSWVVWNLGAFNWGRVQFFTTVGNVRLFMRQWLTAQDMAMGLSRVFDILEIEPDIKDNKGAKEIFEVKDKIEYKDISFGYEENQTVLENISFEAETGSITAVIGPTGSGKTTLTSLLLRLFEPRKGEITIDNLNIRDIKISSLRKNISLALQENVLFSMSIRDNIKYVAPSASDEDLRKAIQVSCMEDFIEELPQQLNTVLSDRGGKLSTGQRQRLSIARAIIRNAPILILDEPTASLDALTEQRVLKNLSEWGKDKVIFLITHRISTIKRANSIIFLDEGRVLEQGNHEALMAIENGNYRRFIESEMELTRELEDEEQK
ncbi:MAG: ATP-binding cassette domain-containing protein [Gammaproteobacteria bacterium]